MGPSWAPSEATPPTSQPAWSLSQVNCVWKTLTPVQSWSQREDTALTVLKMPSNKCLSAHLHCVSMSRLWLWWSAGGASVRRGWGCLLLDTGGPNAQHSWAPQPSWWHFRETVVKKGQKMQHWQWGVRRNLVPLRGGGGKTGRKEGSEVLPGKKRKVGESALVFAFVSHHPTLF